MRQPLVFVGSSAVGLELLGRREDFQLRGALCLLSRITPALVQAAQEAGLELVAFDGAAGLCEAVDRFPAELPFFIYQLDMLVPADLALARAFYNVHRGNMLSNRGPTPDIWPILEGETQSTISLHRIDDKVDAGWLIAAVDVVLNEDDDPRSVCRRMEQHLPELLDALAEHLRGKRPSQRLQGGRYRPWVSEADFSIDPAQDSAAVIDRKIRSQRPYNGALLWLGGERHYVLALIDDRPDHGGPDGHRIEGDMLVVHVGGRQLSFRRNPAPKYPPLLARPPSRRI